jgi:hypothetical protein
MIFFDQAEFAKIPIWENKRRIKALTAFADLYKDTLKSTAKPQIAESATARPIITPEQRRSELNRRKPAIMKTVALAGIRSFRATVKPNGAPIDIDIIDHLWELQTNLLSSILLVDVLEEAIGVYCDDQVKSWTRTLNPFFWLGRLIDWVADLVFNVVALFGASPDQARASILGRLIIAVERLILWLAAIVTVLEFLGFQTPIRHLLRLQ